MLYQVPRTCTFYPDDTSPESHEIAFFREQDAYVLLGDPGAGKTTLFEQEATDNVGIYLSARDFLAFNRTEWQGKTLFIDGLDETRAGKEDVRTPLDAIRGKLDQLGLPRFRLSCREADWLGGNDQTALNACAPSGKVIVLHLNELTDNDIRTILENDDRVEDVESFMQKAKQFSLEGLLHNPQTLDMLIAAVQENNWPKTKLETYQLACQKMAVEHSDEHKASRKKQSNNIEPLLNAAGFLYATQLLANASAFNESDDASEGQVCLNTIKIPDDLPCTQALKSRLFTKQYAPVHRSVAEFLGARFLAKKISAGLPLSRVLALMTGFDGGVVSALRGLMSWLCAHSLDARNYLIEIDPLGVVLYGDVQLFSTQTKQQLLSALRHEAKRNGYLRYDYWASYPFAALTTKDMASKLLELLNSPSREKHDQQILNCVLVGLYRSSEPIPELKEALISVVRDKTYMEGIRDEALQVLRHQFPEDIAILLVLAEGFHTNKIEDIQGRYLSFILSELFPEFISARNIFDYFVPANHDIHSTRISISFWDSPFISLIKAKVKDPDVPILLDEIVKRGINVQLQSQVYGKFSLAGELLVRALPIFGNSISVERLYDWLSLGLDEYHQPHLENEHQERIRTWLESRPERYLELIDEGLNQIADLKNVRFEINKVLERLYCALPPDNLGLWWLDHALVADDQRKNAYFGEAWWLQIKDRGNKGLSLEFFENWVEQHSEFREIYQESIVCKLEQTQREHVERRKNWAIKREKEMAERLAYFNEHRLSIQEGSAHPAVLYDLAVHIEHDANANGKDGRKRFADFLGDDETLIRATKSGMRKIHTRSDLPEIPAIFALAVKQQQHYIRLPFLICMGELYQENPAMLAKLSDDLAAKALAFWYTYGAGNEPVWVKPLSCSRPALAAKVFIEYVSAMLAGKVQYIYGVYQLAHEPEYHEIANLAAIPLLEIYPARANKQQASTLEYLLKAAIAHGDKARLLTLIAEKLVLKSLDIAQRVYWLSTGLIVAPTLYAAKVKKYVAGNVTRINHLSTFLYSGFDSRKHSVLLPPATLGLIVELLTPRCTPYWPERTNSRVTRAMNEGDYVNSLLKRLSENPDVESTQIIEHLLSLPQLSAWHESLSTARQTQQIYRREALFRHPSAVEVAQTLNNLKPANVADLSALAMDHLSKLPSEMRSSNTDNYKRFWNEDSYSRPNDPKTENSCRDYLAEKLKARLLPLDIEVQPETHEANDKRADMRLSCHSDGSAFHLPIEIKLDHSPDLWRALHEQLIPLYTLDPETQGHGIFLVLWFGEKNMPAPPSGKKPKTAAELEARLVETLTTEEKKLIDVFVLDVSNPVNAL
jgi:hypothetical protein